MTRDAIDALLAEHTDHPLAVVLREMIGLHDHWKGIAEFHQNKRQESANHEVELDRLRQHVWQLQAELEESYKERPPAVPTDAETLIELLKLKNATVYEQDGERRLRVPPGSFDKPTIEALKPHLARHRDAIMEALDRADWATCVECKSEVYSADPDTVFHLCRRTTCPYWSPNHPDNSPGFQRQRETDFWRRRKDAEKAAAEAANPVPL
jgi:hypothetical protein